MQVKIAKTSRLIVSEKLKIYLSTNGKEYTYETHKKSHETQDNKLSYIYFKRRTTYIAAFHHMKKITLLTHIFDLVELHSTMGAIEKK